MLPEPVRRSAPLEQPEGVSQQAMDLLSVSDVIDLHLDSFIVHRLTGRDLQQRHGLGALGGRFFGHLDVPTAIASGLTGGMWSITTNPFRTAASRWRVFQDNLKRFVAQLSGDQRHVAIVRNYAEWLRARQAGLHACMPAIQGGNALEAAPNGALSIPDDLITRVTLVHLTDSVYGPTSSPLSLRRKGLTAAGKAFIEQLNEARIFVDLAHIGARGFWDAVDVHDGAQPLLATHTGVCGIKPHWRNLDDAQIRAVADTGGVVGIIFQSDFLRRRGGPRDVNMVVEHMTHVANVGGDDCVAIGSDYDGAIVPPTDLRDGFAPARLIDALLQHGWTETRIQKVLAGNFLRCFEQIRPGDSSLS
ncbi:MAG: membrane dipeptidase [Myxococcales bacterium]|nr:membrane dipeptidase [Myxococcales bacterium]